MTTNEYFRNVYEKGWQGLHGRLWQRNYYERIIRNEKELMKISEYIRNNPLQWDMDEENPANWR
jgi:REP element-mobilizing transposase RayT